MGSGSIKNDNSQKQKINWDGHVVPEGPWYDKTIMTIDGTPIKTKEVLIGTGGIIAIVLITMAILSYISYRKRKAIAIVAKRLSTRLSQTSEKIRRSFSQSLRINSQTANN